jgi:hypothetical protein
VIIFPNGLDNDGADDGGEGGELAVRLVGLCTVLFAVVVGGEIGAAIFGDGGAVTVS